MKPFSILHFPFSIAALALVLSARADTSDFTRTVTENYNGHEGVTFVRCAKSGTPRGFAFAFDLSKGYRLRAWLGDTGAKNAERATVGEMAEALAAAESAVPIAGINGDYFRTDSDIARPGGLVIADSSLVHGGWSVSNSTDYCYIAGLGDGNVYHGKLDCAAGYPGGDPSTSWQVNALGKKVRNAVRTNYQNYPVRAGTINPVGGGNSVDGYVFSTTIGNYQSRNSYWRTLVGIGTNAVGVATNLVLFTSDGSAGFADVDAYQLMIDLGCNEVGELDGGGSAQMWAEAGADAVFRGTTTTHGGYVMRPRDTNPIRAIATGIFVLPPAAKPDPVEVASGNTYPDFDEALLAICSRDAVSIHARTTVTSTNAIGSRTFALTDPAEARLIRSRAEPSLACEAVAVGDGLYRLGWTTNAFFSVPWFSATAATGKTYGGAWTTAPTLSGGTWQVRPDADAVFAAQESRGGVVRVEIAFAPDCGCLPSKLPSLLAKAVAQGERAAIATVEEDDGSISLCGLALVDGEPAWVPLRGQTFASGTSTCLAIAAAEFDFSGETPMVSYLSSEGSSSLCRLTFSNGAAWLPAIGTGPTLAGNGWLTGYADVSSLIGTSAGKAISREATLIILE